MNDLPINSKAGRWNWFCLHFSIPAHIIPAYENGSYGDEIMYPQGDDLSYAAYGEF